MMHEYDVNIRVPAADQESDIILISGVPSHVEKAKAGMADKLIMLEAGKEDRMKRSFEVTVEVKPEYHPKIIGRAGAVINKMREDYKVNIQLPSKGAENQEIITITGYEADANAAKDAILKIVNQYESMIKEEVQIDPRCHSMIIGRRGRTIKKIMDDYKVDIRLPRDHDEDPSLVVVSGDEDDVMQCIEHLKVSFQLFTFFYFDKEINKIKGCSI
jgi:polyribonucleotide nucleotidyltransferase